ncbi:hypothetical protein GUITHDRAFT_166669 [Guillardia theta CCMP2712]|uniref:ABM domain-containing protein n=1 Tax=Guillardia theta (strain CCMP2712) TaxID=905079 RepID=L1I9K8_GUITC|nr:hypothetical protein GUITHDRAFT_166669 [Guillardia theta CCMP2712]EKX32594.1 hypothetical protein GUITHDRAFT_166669 [Guillardia theta CCMP2712]|eukprot:XP_005819574.1 hypothetical protein GUITHDRAFT_166669 [Guillardia theta CCMP2712]
MLRAAVWMAMLEVAFTYNLPSSLFFRRQVLTKCNLAHMPLHRHFRPRLTPAMSQSISTERQGVGTATRERERYVVFNRFQTRDGAGAKFEKRWADRKSSLKQMEGFRLFSLLRRIDDDASDSKGYPEDFQDYMSMTVWENKENFDSWRKGYAFKEAHGGGSLGGFLSAMIGSMMVLRTSPTPAMWDGLFPKASTKQLAALALQGRDEHGKVVADGKAKIPTDCFMTMDFYQLKDQSDDKFEQLWSQISPQLQEDDRCLASILLRRAGSKATRPDDAFTYASCSFWPSEAVWKEWKESEGRPLLSSLEEQISSSAAVENRFTSRWEGTLLLSAPNGI